MPRFPDRLSPNKTKQPNMTMLFSSYRACYRVQRTTVKFIEASSYQIRRSTRSVSWEFTLDTCQRHHRRSAALTVHHPTLNTELGVVKLEWASRASCEYMRKVLAGFGQQFKLHIQIMAVVDIYIRYCKAARGSEVAETVYGAETSSVGSTLHLLMHYKNTW